MAPRWASGRRAAPGWLALVATGCTQGGLDPRGSEAARIFDITVWLTVAAAVVCLIVVAVFVWAVSRPGRAARERADHLPDTAFERRLVVGGGIVMPAIVLAGFFGVQIWSTMQQPQVGELTIEVIGHRYWWEVRYGDAAAGVITANQIHVPAGTEVTIRLTSDDVIHSFWVPELAGKVDLTPGRVNEFTFAADEPGTYEGFCAEFCGLQHAWMKFEAVVMPPDEFEEWVRAMAGPAAEPTDDVAARGRDVFLENSCVGCHTIQGVAEASPVGPDLTHLASRNELGAGIVPLDEHTLRAWVVNAQSIKPGVQMPPQQLPPDDLEALVAYLMSLE